MPGDGGFTVDNIGNAASSKRPRGSNPRSHQRQSGSRRPRNLPRRVLKLPHPKQLSRRSSIHRPAPVGPGQDSRHAGSLYLMQTASCRLLPAPTRNAMLWPHISARSSRPSRHLRPRRWQDRLRARLRHVPSGARRRSSLPNLPTDPQTAIDALKDLPGLFPVMPDLKLTEDERPALVAWVNTQRRRASRTAAQRRQLR